MSFYLSVAILMAANIWALAVVRRRKRRRPDAVDMRRQAMWMCDPGR